MRIHGLDQIWKQAEEAACPQFGNRVEAIKRYSDGIEFAVHVLAGLGLASLGVLGREWDAVPEPLRQGGRMTLGQWVRTLRSALETIRRLPPSPEAEFAGLVGRAVSPDDLKALDRFVSARNRFIHSAEEIGLDGPRQVASNLRRALAALPFEIGAITDARPGDGEVACRVEFPCPCLPARTVILPLPRRPLVKEAALALEGGGVVPLAPWFFLNPGGVAVLDAAVENDVEGLLLENLQRVRQAVSGPGPFSRYRDPARDLPRFDAVVVSLVPLLGTADTLGAPSLPGIELDAIDPRFPGCRIGTIVTRHTQKNVLDLLLWRRHFHLDLIEGRLAAPGVDEAPVTRLPYVMSLFFVRPIDPPSAAVECSLQALAEPSLIGLDDSPKNTIRGEVLDAAVARLRRMVEEPAPVDSIRQVAIDSHRHFRISWANVVGVHFGWPDELCQDLVEREKTLQALWASCDDIVTSGRAPSRPESQALRAAFLQLQRPGATMSSAERKVLDALVATSDLGNLVAAALSLAEGGLP